VFHKKIIVIGWIATKQGMNLWKPRARLTPSHSSNRLWLKLSGPLEGDFPQLGKGKHPHE
jgi:hypothetical protein